VGSVAGHRAPVAIWSDTTGLVTTRRAGYRDRVRWSVLILVAACYQPQDPASCELTCSGAARSCPSGFTCGTDSLNAGRCVVDPMDRCSEPGTDAGQICLGSAFPQCFGVEPTKMITLVGLIDTDADPRCISVPQVGVVGAPALCVIVGATIATSGSVQVTGGHALALIARDTVTIPMDSTLDVSSKQRGTLGPGADQVPCTSKPGGMNPTGKPGGGGAGGSFHGVGGQGGLGDAANATAGDAGMVTSDLGVVRGGCGGGRGGTPGSIVDNGGHGGGALYISADNAIIIEGTINGSGGGGTAVAFAGGGGGGSGGYVGLDAPQVLGNGIVFTRGGSGAAGSNTTKGADGQDPADSTSPTLGLPGIDGGDGGDGSPPNGSMVDGVKAPNGDGELTVGGGGGGGAAGWIVSYRASSTAFTPTTIPTLVMK